MAVYGGRIAICGVFLFCVGRKNSGGVKLLDLVLSRVFSFHGHCIRAQALFYSSLPIVKGRV